MDLNKNRRINKIVCLNNFSFFGNLQGVPYRYSINLFVVFISIINLSSCGESEKQESPVSGNISISVDESFGPIISAEVNTFEALYPKAKINTGFKSETEAIDDFLKEKSDMIIVSRELTEKEKKYFESKKLIPTSDKIAFDGLVFIIHKDNSDSLLNIDQLAEIFNGTVKKWNSLKEEIQIVVDKGSSSNLLYIDKKFGLQKDSIKIYAAGTNSKVIEHVKNNRNAIGVIGLNWVSDYDDPFIRANLKLVNIVRIGKGGEKNFENYFSPSQSNLAEGKYPVQRTLYMVNKNAKAGLGTGFASFLISDVGQRIILKSGILPAIMPGREIEVK